MALLATAGPNHRATTATAATREATRLPTLPVIPTSPYIDPGVGLAETGATATRSRLASPAFLSALLRVVEPTPKGGYPPMGLSKGASDSSLYK